MDKEAIEKLLTVVTSDTDKAALAVLFNAWMRSFNTLKSDSSKGNISEWRASEKALKEKFEELQTKYGDVDEDVRLSDRHAAVKFLQELGYKIKKSKFYKDASAGHVRINPDGSIDESVCRAYAERYLVRVKSAGVDEGEIDKIHRDKAIAETKRAQLQAEKLQFDMDKEKGLYLSREEVITQFAIKWSLIEATVKHVLQSKAIELIRSVGGDVKKKDLFVDLCFVEIDDRLNQLAVIEDLKISLIMDDERELERVVQ